MQTQTPRTDYLLSHDSIHRPWKHIHVTVSKDSKPFMTFIKPIFSEYEFGPNLQHLANATAEITSTPGKYGLWGLEESIFSQK